MAVTVYGYRFSVYTRVLKMVLTVRAVPYRMRETDPFADPPDPELARVSRFGLVPVLDHDGFTICETSAITRHVARAFPGAPLVPQDARAAARMDQVIAIIDAHGYWPMVRQVFAHGVFRPMIGAPADPAQVAEGLKAAEPVLRALDDVAREALVLSPAAITLADLHLAPMIGYFTAAPQGAKALRAHPALGRWWARMQQHPAYPATDPGLATLATGR